MSCSGVTRERFRFSLSHFPPAALIDFDLCGPEDGGLPGSASLLSEGDGELCWTAPTFAGD